MKSLLFAIAILCALPTQIKASTCPPPPIPLRQLVPNSEYILIGRIVSTQEITENDFGGHQAEFEVHHVLQGNIKSKTITLFLDRWKQQFIDENTSDGGRMLIFVNPSRDDKNVYVPSSYQSSYKMIDEAGLQIYRQRIKQLQAINTLKDETRRNLLTTDWLIDCANNPYTYWEGAIDLGPTGNFLKHYDYEKEEFITRIELSVQQKQQIRAIILGQTEITYLELGLIMTVTDGPDPELLKFMIKTLASTPTEHLYRNQGLMRQIAVVSERQDLSDVLAEIYTLEYDDDYEENANKLAQDFIKKL